MNELRTLLNEDSACLIGPLAWEVCIIVVLSIVRASGTRRFLRDFGRGRAGLDSNVNDNTDDAWVNARCERLSIGHASRPRRSAKNNLNALQNSKEISLRVRPRVSFETRKNASPPRGIYSDIFIPHGHFRKYFKCLPCENSTRHIGLCIHFILSHAFAVCPPFATCCIIGSTCCAPRAKVITRRSPRLPDNFPHPTGDAQVTSGACTLLFMRNTLFARGTRRSRLR